MLAHPRRRDPTQRAVQPVPLLGLRSPRGPAVLPEWDPQAAGCPRGPSPKLGTPALPGLSFLKMGTAPGVSYPSVLRIWIEILHQPGQVPESSCREHVVEMPLSSTPAPGPRTFLVWLLASGRGRRASSWKCGGLLWALMAPRRVSSGLYLDTVSGLEWPPGHMVSRSPVDKFQRSRGVRLT